MMSPANSRALSPGLARVPRGAGRTATCWFLAAILTAAIACSAADAKDGAGTTTKFVRGANGERMLEKAYGSINWGIIGQQLGVEWNGIVAAALKQTNIVVANTIRFGACAPNRLMVTERFGKPDATSQQKVPGRNQTSGEGWLISFDWYGSLGLGYLGDKPGSAIVAIGYDPKRDQP
jgi:hypothetical protein